MSRAAEVTLAFGGEDRVFRLPIGRLRALQEKLDCGPLWLIQLLQEGRWRTDHLREIIFQALKGGGMDDGEATALLKAEFDDPPGGYMQFVPLCVAILHPVLFGAQDEPLGEPKAGEEKPKRRSRERKSASDSSTA